jgi:hypothetical protein
LAKWPVDVLVKVVHDYTEDKYSPLPTIATPIDMIELVPETDDRIQEV